MSDDIKVNVFAMAQRGCYYLQWRCPMTGRKKSRSTGITISSKARDRNEAVKQASALEEKLRSNYTAASKSPTWSAFRERYELHVVSGKAKNTFVKVTTVFNSLERIINPQKLTDLTEERIGYFTSQLRLEKKSEASIKGMLAYVKASLRWAKRMKLIAQAPEIEMPSRLAEKSKGRPITGEEFDRMIAAVPKVIDKAEHSPAWERLLRGLWFSGLRLGEALSLSWDDENAIRVDMSGKRPMLNIPAGCDKSGKARLLALTPDFAELLLATPQDARTGLVFALSSRVKGAMLTPDRVKRFICKLGEKANIKVATNSAGKVKFASAHDLRRSFGERWAGRLLPQVLMELMRHAEISTTLTYYSGKNAERTSDAVYEAFQVAQAKQVAKRDEKSEPAVDSPSSQSVEQQTV
jgi:integrase